MFVSLRIFSISSISVILNIRVLTLEGFKQIFKGGRNALFQSENKSTIKIDQDIV